MLTFFTKLTNFTNAVLKTRGQSLYPTGLIAVIIFFAIPSLLKIEITVNDFKTNLLLIPKSNFSHASYLFCHYFFLSWLVPPQDGAMTAKKQLLTTLLFINQFCIANQLCKNS